MKKSFVIYILFILPFLSQAQSLNLTSAKEGNRHFTYLNFGYDFGATTEIGYAYKISSAKPIWLNIDASRPMGEDFLDDHKVRVGAQINVFKKKNFALNARLLANYRAHEDKLVAMTSFGSEISVGMGFYKSSWCIEANIGFDKSIITHLDHKDAMVQNFPEVTNGWFIPSGGNWFYGIQFGKALFSDFYLSLELGVTDAQGDDQNALLPRYFQLGLAKSF